MKTKMKRFKTVRGHVGYLCKLEGGKSQAKIHDAIQILNHHYDLMLEDLILSEVYSLEEVKSFAHKTDKTSSPIVDLFMQAAAKRWLKKNKQTKRSKK